MRISGAFINLFTKSPSTYREPLNQKFNALIYSILFHYCK